MTFLGAQGVRSAIEAPFVSLTFHDAVTPATQLLQSNIKMESTSRSAEQKQHAHLRRAPQPEDEGSLLSHDGQIQRSLTTTCTSLQEGAPAISVLLQKKKKTKNKKQGALEPLAPFCMSLRVFVRIKESKQIITKKLLVHSFEGAFA